jgi:hypothetical protein
VARRPRHQRERGRPTTAALNGEYDAGRDQGVGTDIQSKPTTPARETRALHGPEAKERPHGEIKLTDSVRSMRNWFADRTCRVRPS